MCKVHGATAPLMGMSPAGASKVQGILQEIARQLEAAAEAKIISIESNGLGPQAVANSIADMHNGDEIVIAAPSVRVRFSMVSICSRCAMLVCDWSGCARGSCRGTSRMHSTHVACQALREVHIIELHTLDGTDSFTRTGLLKASPHAPAALADDSLPRKRSPCGSTLRSRPPVTCALLGHGPL